MEMKTLPASRESLAERYFYERLVKLTRTEVAESRGPRKGEKPAFHRCSPPFLYCPHRQRVLRVPLPACFERTKPRWSLPPLLHFESSIFVYRADASPWKFHQRDLGTTERAVLSRDFTISFLLAVEVTFYTGQSVDETKRRNRGNLRNS